MAILRVLWGLVIVMVLVTAGLTSRYLTLNPDVFFQQQREVYLQHLPVLITHAGAGLVAILLGPLQFSSRLRRRFLRAHRWVGRGYLGAVAVSSLAGFYMAQISWGGLASRSGFSMMSTVWAITALIAFGKIRSGDIQGHRLWISRNYAVTLSAVSLRLLIPLFLALGFSFQEVYPTVAWLSWVLNLLIAELVLAYTMGSRRPVSATA